MKPLSFELTQHNNYKLVWQTWLILIIATVVSICAYLSYSAISGRIGFPLDDSWIHQTFARNLAISGEWSFIPGQRSGGSTAPLWSALLSIGFLLDKSPFLWTYFLGGLMLFCLAYFAEVNMRFLVHEYIGVFPWVGLLLAVEWHLVWASVSGMEILLHALIALIILVTLIKKTYNWLVLGFLTGVSVWVRPDGITLLGPIVFVAIVSQHNWKSRIRAVLSVFSGFFVLLLPYLLFNLFLAGTPLPTTFYAKQAEYGFWQRLPILTRLSEGGLKLLTGPGILLIPGAVLATRWAIRNKQWGIIASILWILGYLGIYLFRLPVYQHGRYIMPVMPTFYFIGFFGYYHYQMKSDGQNRIWWFVKTTWTMSLPLVCIGFWLLGIQTYRDDVGFIETAMVDTAKWAATHIPNDDLIASHDIGALGYFSNHKLIDMAGLISPEIIPYLLDEEALAHFLDVRGVEYLITFPDWYPHLTPELEFVYSSEVYPGMIQGEANMVIYRWPRP
jgi:hypothetical protein